MAVLLTALWLGILTSISPCPLATNIATISFLSKNVSHPRLVLRAGIAYTLGRMFVYTVLGILIVVFLVSVSPVANFLQKYMNKALGPVLVLIGLVLLNVIKINFPGFSLSEDKQKKLARSGAGGAFALGVIFALSFCPISAALFFGSLIPLALKSGHGVILPIFFGFGTAFPVVAVSVAMALGVTSLVHLFHKISKIEFYVRRAVAVIFLAVGLYYMWIYLLPRG
jgi:cytochrome c-type biogenesis protein